jgi:hypothetical protein
LAHTLWIHILDKLGHTQRVKIVHISEFDSLKTDDNPENFGWIEAIQPDVVVCTGLAGAPQLKGPPLTNAHILYIPGPGDKRDAFFGAFGRRYRIDLGYPYLDRLVTVGGLTLLLLDTANEALSSRQLLWLQSQLDDLVTSIERGAVLPRICVFSRTPLFSPGRPASPDIPLNTVEAILSHAAVRSASAGGSLTIFCGSDGEDDEKDAVGGHGVRQYTVPGLSSSSAVRIIQIESSGDMETAVMYNHAH